MLMFILLSAALNMSLPEFQPTTDISGNYIVGSYDFDSDRVVVEELTREEAESLSLASTRDGSGTTSVVNADVLSSKRVTNDSYGNPEIANHSGDKVYYVTLEAGVEYTLYGSSVYYSFSSTSGSHIPLTLITLTNGTFTPSTNLYVCGPTNTLIYATYVVSGGGDEPGGDTPSGDVNVDLTSIESKLDKIIVLKRSILFVVLMNFIYPLMMASIKLLRGDKNV